VRRSRVVPYKCQFDVSRLGRRTYILVAVHAQTLNHIDDLCVIVTFLCTCLCDLPAHVLEQILCKAFLFRHLGSMYVVWFACGGGAIIVQKKTWVVGVSELI
jgi:hypothetical protein